MCDNNGISIDFFILLWYNKPIPNKTREEKTVAELQVYKRGCNWEYRFEIASENGKRKFAQKCGFKTKK